MIVTVESPMSVQTFNYARETMVGWDTLRLIEMKI